MIEMRVIEDEETRMPRSPEATPVGNGGDEPHFFTARERSILKLLAEDYTVGQIAEMYSIAYGTVKTHLDNIRIKLELLTR
jgi:DNA-binding NarL/FixJ family response regulator